MPLATVCFLALLFVLPASGITTPQPPIYFEPSAAGPGQPTRFLARTPRALLHLSTAGAEFAARDGSRVRMRLENANPAPAVEPLEALPGRSNYFLGNNPARWRTDVPHYGRIVYRNVYPGIDLVFRAGSEHLEYDFLVSAGADPAVIALRFEGADSMRLDRGDLVLQAGQTEIRHKRPLVYQTAGDAGAQVDGGFALRADGSVGFRFGEFDPQAPLTVDPEIVFSTYYGGTSGESATDAAVDRAGNIYVTGSTYSQDFPTMNPFQGTHPVPGERAAFVVKMNPAGNTVLYATYLGGAQGRNLGNAIAVDADGAAYVTGETYSLSFPVTAGAYQSTADPIVGEDGFVTKLSPAGNALLYSTYIAATGHEYLMDLAIDSAGNAYVAGSYTPHSSRPANFPTTPGAYRTAVCSGNTQEAFLFKLNPGGTALVYSTFLCGTGYDYARAVAVDAAGSAFVTGDTGSADFPAVQPFQSQVKGGLDAFVLKINPEGSALVYSTFLGGAGQDHAYGIALDAAGQAYVTGRTLSTDFPVRNPIQATNRLGSDDYNSGGDAFVAKLNPQGNALLYSTFLGGTAADSARAIAIDPAGNAFVAGSTRSSNFPAVNSPRPFSGSRDAFVFKLNPAGSALLYSALLGGTDSEDFLADSAGGLALGSEARAFIVGETASADFPVVAPYQASMRGDSDVFLARLDDTRSPHVSAASYYGAELAADAIASFFGANLTNTTAAATSLPLPATLGGASITVRDSAGADHAGLLFFASPGQINYLLPAGVAAGNATITVRTASGATLAHTMAIEPGAPGLFSANASGQGVAAGSLLRIRTDGSRSSGVIAAWNGTSHQPVPIDLGPAGEEVVVTLYGTGIRGAGQANVSAVVGGVAADVLYAGPQGDFVGLDQINLRLPRSLAGRGMVPVALSAGGKPSNTVQLQIQ